MRKMYQNIAFLEKDKIEPNKHGLWYPGYKVPFEDINGAYIKEIRIKNIIFYQITVPV